MFVFQIYYRDASREISKYDPGIINKYDDFNLNHCDIVKTGMPDI